MVKPPSTRRPGTHDLERQDNSPLKDVVPAESESERLVEHSRGEGVETTRDRVQNSHFTKSLGDLRMSATVNDVMFRATTLTLINMTPMIIQAIKIPRGPPVRRAEPEPTWVADQQLFVLERASSNLRRDRYQ